MKHIISAALLAVGTTAVHADVKLLTIETFMHAQANDVLALSLVFPTPVTETLQYSYTVNTNDGSFAYQTLAGQTHSGLAYSLAGTGMFDANTQTYTWSASGVLGSQTWSQTAQATWVSDDPTATIRNVAIRNATINGTVTWGIGGEGTVSGTVGVTVAGESSGKVTFTPRGGIPQTFDITDSVPLINPDLPWELRYQDRVGKFIPVKVQFVNHNVTNGIYQGTSIFTVSAVPEAETYAMMLAGLGLLGAVSWRRATKLSVHCHAI